MTKYSNRHGILDISRFLAAFMVLLTHLNNLNLDFQILFKEKAITQLFQGYYYVNFFFTLSGFVLMISFQNTSGLNFIKIRFMRLLPAYYFALVPLLLLYSFYHFGPKITISGQILTLLCSQSLTFTHRIDSPNHSLWSLSVEIYLSFVFLFFRKKSVVVVFSSILGIMYLSELSVIKTPMASGACYFLGGVLSWKIGNKVKRLTSCLMILIVLISFWLFLSFKDYSISFIRILLMASFTLVLSKMPELKGRLRKISLSLGSRIYSLYLVHWPIIALFPALNRFLHIPSKLCVVVIVMLCFTAMELTFRLVDQPATRKARQYYIISKN